MNEKYEFYIPSLDGARAVAALLVFVGHAGLGHIIPGGFGVTTFFFLSGYLITTLLRKEFEKYGSISLKNFYLRRVYRILPPMYFVLAVILALIATGLINGDPSPMGILAQVFQFTNYYVLIASPAGIPPGTGSFWSLAVEEHFYLLFPLFLIFCLRRWDYRQTVRVFALVCLAVLCWRLFLVCGMHVSDDRTYLATDTRLDSLLFGCMMGLWNNPVLDRAPTVLEKRSIQWLTGLGGILLLMFSLVYRDPAFRETLRYTLQGIALFPLFWLAIRHADAPVFRPLNWKLVRGLGVISYSFYLTHLFWLGIADAYLGRHTLMAGMAAFAAAVGSGILIHHFIEKPFAGLRKRLHAHQKPVGRAGTAPRVTMAGLAGDQETCPESRPVR